MVGPATAAADYELTAESPGCGYPRFYPPIVGSSGNLIDSDYVRGPAGALFGRTLGAIKARLVWWDVPMSDGARFRVHRRLLPVLEDVEANLTEAAAGGRHYAIRASESYGFSARTSIAHDAVSYHGLGAAVDINPSTNPYRVDGRLVTDMPAWFVAAWEDAGMCWGGSWLFVKDPMHFSWMGPAASPSYAAIPPPIAPLTAASSFTTTIGRHDVVFGPTSNPSFVTEASGDGAPDVAHVRPWGDHAVLELATSRAAFADCSVWRWWLDDPPNGTPHLADVDGVGRPDLVYVDGSGAVVVLHRYSAAEGYRRATTIVTGVETSPGQRHVFGDTNGDGADDLWVVEETGDGLAVSVWRAADGFAQASASGVIAGASGDRLVTADRTVDGRDELLVVDAGEGSSVIEVVSAASPGTVIETVTGPALSASDEIGFEDYDGDGRPDLVVLSDTGGLQAYRGNTPLTGVTASSWFLAPDFDCPEGTVPYHHVGTFADDDGSVFEADIEWLAASGTTRGCNPPFQDRFCPDDHVTRGQMAAFLNRYLELAPADSPFVDAAGSVFEADIGALAAAGVTRGCNPPANDRFCPGGQVTRGQMAAFLTRALNLPVAESRFVDAAGSVFEADIGALAAAGVTRGCNPPANDRFCPGGQVTRGQMAAFLHRGAGLLPDS